MQWDQSDRAYILTHGVSGVEWAHYRHPLSEQVYDVYMRYWKDGRFRTLVICSLRQLSIAKRGDITRIDEQ